MKVMQCLTCLQRSVAANLTHFYLNHILFSGWSIIETVKKQNHIIVMQCLQHCETYIYITYLLSLPVPCVRHDVYAEEDHN